MPHFIQTPRAQREGGEGGGEEREIPDAFIKDHFGHSRKLLAAPTPSYEQLPCGLQPFPAGSQPGNELAPVPESYPKDGRRFVP